MLRGSLGAGKTALTRGVASVLSPGSRVKSPSYTIVNEYTSGQIPLFHFDLYRLSGPDDLFDIGWEDYLDRKGVCAVEWSENAADALTDALRIDLRRGQGDQERIITVTGGEWE